MASKTVFLGRMRNPITKEYFDRVRGDPAYVQVRAFDNGKIRAYALWRGHATLKSGQPLSDAKVFELVVENIITVDAEDRPLPAVKVVRDPATSGWFRTEQEMINAYEDLLVRYAGCEWVPSSSTASGLQLIERGNKLAPLDKSVPVPDESVNSECYGAW